jgi:hypothetical protein
MIKTALPKIDQDCCKTTRNGRTITTRNWNQDKYDRWTDELPQLLGSSCVGMHVL